MNETLEIIGSIALRAAVIYLALLAMLRLGGRRELAQLTPADVLLLLLLSEAVSPALSGGHDHIWTGLLSAAILIALTFLIGWLTFRSPRFEEIVEGNSVVLVRHGKLDEKVLRSLHITDGQLRTFLHEHGLLRVEQVAVAYVEPSGKVTMVKADEKPEQKASSPSSEARQAREAREASESFDEVAALGEIKSRLEELERVFSRKRRALHAASAHASRAPQHEPY